MGDEYTIVEISISICLERPLSDSGRRHTLVKIHQSGGEIIFEMLPTVPVRASHKSPPLQPPSRQEFGPGLLLKSQLRLACSGVRYNRLYDLTVTDPDTTGFPIIGDGEGNFGVGAGGPATIM